MDLQDGLDFKIVLSRDNLIGKPEDGKLSNKDYIVQDNPGIYNYVAGDFRVKPAALKYGFRKTNYKRIGLQKDTYRDSPQKSLSTQ